MINTKIEKSDRKKLEYYLKEFYKLHSKEKWTIFHFVKFSKLRLKNNKDMWCGVSGDTGTGKSLFVIMYQILFGRPYDLKKNITYIPKGNEIIEKFSKLWFNTLLIDEAAKEMRSVNWQSKSQQAVNTTAMTDRFKNNAVFLNMPNFAEFTKSMKTGNLIFRAIIPFRTDTYARVFIQRKSRNWRSDDPWGDKYANELYDKVTKGKKEITNDVITDIERKIPNTVMDFIIPNLELILPEITNKYDELKRESREISQEEDYNLHNKKNIYKEKFDNLLIVVSKLLVNNELDLGKVRVTKSEIASKLNVSIETLNKYLFKEIPEKKNFREKKIKSFK